jgi:hypothetical protein
MGGGAPALHTLKESSLLSYCQSGVDMDELQDSDFLFVQYVTIHEASVHCSQDSSIHPFDLPVHILLKWLSCDELQNMATLHNVRFTSKHQKSDLSDLLKNHNCDMCDLYVSLFKSHDAKSAHQKCS